MAISKVIFDGQTLIDISLDSVAAATLLRGETAHGSDGEQVIGTCDYDVDSTIATDPAGSSEILNGKKAYANGALVTGSMANHGGSDVEINDLTGTAITAGYYDGTGKAKLSAAAAAPVQAGNIKDGITILGVLGTYTGAAISAQAKTVTPTASAQTVYPDTPTYDYLSSVTVNAIPYVETTNAGGGKTATIG